MAKGARNAAGRARSARAPDRARAGLSAAIWTARSGARRTSSCATHGAARLERVVRDLNDVIAKASLEEIGELQELVTQLEKLRAELRFADRGYSGFFDEPKLDGEAGAGRGVRAGRAHRRAGRRGRGAGGRRRVLAGQAARQRETTRARARRSAQRDPGPGIEVVMSQFIEVIECLDRSAETLVSRFPEQGSAEIKLGAQLVVRDSQAAIFVRDGRALDTFGAGPTHAHDPERAAADEGAVAADRRSRARSAPRCTS